MTATIKSPVVPVARPEVNLSWTPLGSAVTYLVDGDVYSNDSVDPATLLHPPVFETPVGQELTFVADVAAPIGVSIVEYHWDFGDGTQGYGTPIAHTYRVASPQTRCVLTVLDTLNRLTSGARQITLVPSIAIQISSLRVRA